MRYVPSLRARVLAHVGSLVIDAEIDTRGGALVLIGPNGAGKTTLLSLLLGVLPSRQGHIQIGDAVLLDTNARVDVPVEERRLGYLPQDYALFPHLSVRENVAFAVRSASDKKDAARSDEQVDTALRDLDIMPLADRRTQTLSGGEKQRVALARALSVEPRALLLDEPLAALDVRSRREVRSFLSKTLDALAIPTIVVTHDPIDARVLGRHIVVLESGRVTQAGTWDNLVDQPRSRFVEEFVASARSDLECPPG